MNVYIDCGYVSCAGCYLLVAAYFRSSYVTLIDFDLTAIYITLLLVAIESRSILLKIYDKILLILIGSNNFGRRHTLA